MASIDVLTAGGFRRDGRRPTQYRHIVAEVGSLQANMGAAVWSNGKTTVMAQCIEDDKMSVNGLPSLDVSVSWAPFAFPERRFRAGNERLATVYQKAIKNVFEPLLLNKSNAGTTINMQLTILCADGGILAACLNAVTLCLTRSGYALDDLLVATCVAYVENSVFVDPTHFETVKASSHLTIACLARSKEVALLVSKSKLNIEILEELMQCGIQAISEVVLSEIVKAQETHARRVCVMKTVVSERLCHRIN